MESNKRFWEVHTQWSHHGGEFQRASYSIPFLIPLSVCSCVAVFAIFFFVWTNKIFHDKVSRTWRLHIMFFSYFGIACLLCADELNVALWSRCNPKASHYPLDGFSTLYNNETQWENIWDDMAQQREWLCICMDWHTGHVRTDTQ